MSSVDSILFGHEGARVVDEQISVEGVAVRWDAHEDDTILIDDFNAERSEQPSPQTNLIGGANTSAGFERDEEVSPWRPDEENPGWVYNKASARILEAAQGETGTLTLELEEEIRFGAESTLEAVVKGPREGDTAEFTVVFQWDEGERRIDGRAYIGPESLRERYTQLVIPFEVLELQAPVELESVTIEVRSGTLFLDDVRVTHARLED